AEERHAAVGEHGAENLHAVSQDVDRARGARVPVGVDVDVAQNGLRAGEDRQVAAVTAAHVDERAEVDVAAIGGEGDAAAESEVSARGVDQRRGLDGDGGPAGDVDDATGGVGGEITGAQLSADGDRAARDDDDVAGVQVARYVDAALGGSVV